MRKGWIAVIIGVGFVGMCIAGILAFSADSPSTTAKVTPVTPSAHPSRKGVAKPAGIGPGMYLVGKDIKAGKYKTKGAIEGVVTLGYYHTAKDTTDNTIQEQGVLSESTQSAIITLKNGEYFKTSGCQPWLPV